MTTIHVVPEPSLVEPVTIDASICTGCNRCVQACPSDLFLPRPRKGQPPVVAYPGECWFDGSCVEACPCPGAIVLNRPPASRVHWQPRDACLAARRGTAPRDTTC